MIIVEVRVHVVNNFPSSEMLEVIIKNVVGVQSGVSAKNVVLNLLQVKLFLHFTILLIQIVHIMIGY